MNFIAPFLTKSYSDIALLQMPKELPFTIDSVGRTADSIVIAGRVAWSADPKPAVPDRIAVAHQKRRESESTSYLRREETRALPLHR